MTTAHPGRPRSGEQCFSVWLKILLSVACAHIAARPAASQCVAPLAAVTAGDTLRECPRVAPAPPGSAARAHAIDLAANVGLAAVTSGLRAWHGGHSFWRAFATGAGAGAVTYGGRRISASRWAGAGLAGRQTAALGASVMRNAANGRGIFSGAVLPLGPIRVYVNEPESGDTTSRRTRVKLDLATAVGLVYAATRPGARLDAARSLASGALVFDGIRMYPDAAHVAGVVMLATEDEASYAPDAPRSRLVAHEMVHVTQYDFSFVAWAEPAERALLRAMPGGERLHRHVDLGLNMPAWGFLNLTIGYKDRPWEREARLLTDRPWP